MHSVFTQTFEAFVSPPHACNIHVSTTPHWFILLILLSCSRALQHFITCACFFCPQQRSSRSRCASGSSFIPTSPWKSRRSWQGTNKWAWWRDGGGGGGISGSTWIITCTHNTVTVTQTKSASLQLLSPQLLPWGAPPPSVVLYVFSVSPSCTLAFNA